MHSLAALALPLLAPSAAAISLGISQLKASPEVSSEYYWPQPRGRPESYGVSSYPSPRLLTEETLAWHWFPNGDESPSSGMAHSGLVLDDEKSIYLSSTDGIRKFSKDGEPLWFFKLLTWRIPSLAKGRLYVTGNDGFAYAVDMKTGEQVWNKSFTDVLGTDISGVGIFGDVLIGEAAGNKDGGAAAVAALNITDGRKLWEFKSDSRLWNMMPMDTGKGSVVFQDQIGGVYHLRISDGQRLWRAGYTGAWADEMTDGLAMVKDDVVYAVHSDGMCCQANQAATLRAYDLESGAEMWSRAFGHPVNSQPVVGFLGKGQGLTERQAVVVPVGAQPVGIPDRYNSSVQALDAKTGEVIWEYAFPPWDGVMVRGDPERLISGAFVCMPNPYASPSVDSRGTVYLGHFNGMAYAIRDDDGDGKIQESEVSQYDTYAGFSHGGAALAPGMMAIANCNGVYVFKG